MELVPLACEDGIKQTVCKVLKIFQHGKYLAAYVLKRTCHQTNYSEGVFVRNVPLLFFLYLFSLFLLHFQRSIIRLMPFCPFLKWGYLAAGVPSENTGGGGDQVGLLGYLVAGNWHILTV